MFQQTFKNFGFNFNSSNENNAVTSGDVITGHISFDLVKQTNISAIVMTVKGGAHVHWSTGGGKNRRTYSAKLCFFAFKTTLMAEDSAVGGRTTLQPGTHVFPFSCQLPLGNFPSAFHGVNGQISYTLTVGIHRPWHMVKSFVTELNYVDRSHVDTPELRAPLSGTNSTMSGCMWWASSPVVVAANTERKAFNPGETVRVICQFSNGSSKTATPKVKLHQKQTFFTLNKVSRRVVPKTLVSLTGQPVMAHTSGQHEVIRVLIPPSTPPSISNCDILVVEYVIEVSLCVGSCTDITVLFPIIVCGTPIPANPPELM